MSTQQTAVRAIIFDLGNVLLPFDHGKMTRQLAAVLQADPSELATFLFGPDEWFLKLENGDFPLDEAHRRLCERFADCSLDEFANAGGDIFVYDEPMHRLTRTLKELGLRLVLLSNTSALHIDYVRRTYDTLEPFDELTLSYQVQASKPDSAIYRHAIGQAGCEATECLFVDDRADNIAGAEAVGLRSHLFRGIGELLPWLRSQGVAV